MSDKIIYLKYVKTKEKLDEMKKINLDNDEDQFDSEDFLETFEKTMNSLYKKYKINENKRNFIKMLNLKRDSSQNENCFIEIKNEEDYSEKILKNNEFVFHIILYNEEKEIKKRREEEEKKRKEEEEKRKEEEEKKIKDEEKRKKEGKEKKKEEEEEINPLRHSNTNVEINNNGNLEKRIEEIFKLNTRIYKQTLENKKKLDQILNLLNENKGINLSINESVEKNSDSNLINPNLPTYDIEYDNSEKIIFLKELIKKKCTIDITLKNKQVLIPKNFYISFFKEKYDKDIGITFDDILLNEIQANEKYELNIKLKINKDVYKIKNELELFYILKDNNKNIINKNSFGKINLKINNYPFIYEEGEKYIKEYLQHLSSEEIQNCLIKFEGKKDEALDYLINNN